MKNNNNLTPIEFKEQLIKISAYYYPNPLSQRNEITNKIKGKAGVYCWYNNVNGNFYIGSAVNLNPRINDYFQEWYLREKNNLIIVRALTHYKMDSFSLLILEVTDKDNVLNREQYYLDEFKPVYNILTKVYNSLGFTHTEESIEKIRQKAVGRTQSLEVRKRMSENRKGYNNSFYGKTHTLENIAKMRERALSRTFDPKPGFKVEVEDLKTNTKTIYKSMQDCAKSLNSHLSSLLRWEKRERKKPFKGRYNIVIMRS